MTQPGRYHRPQRQVHHQVAWRSPRASNMALAVASWPGRQPQRAQGELRQRMQRAARAIRAARRLCGDGHRRRLRPGLSRLWQGRSRHPPGGVVDAMSADADGSHWVAGSKPAICCRVGAGQHRAGRGARLCQGQGRRLHRRRDPARTLNVSSTRSRSLARQHRRRAAWQYRHGRLPLRAVLAP